MQVIRKQTSHLNPFLTNCLRPPFKESPLQCLSLHVPAHLEDKLTPRPLALFFQKPLCEHDSPCPLPPPPLHISKKGSHSPPISSRCEEHTQLQTSASTHANWRTDKSSKRPWQVLRTVSLAKSPKIEGFSSWSCIPPSDSDGEASSDEEAPDHQRKTATVLIQPTPGHN